MKFAPLLLLLLTGLLNTLPVNADPVAIHEIAVGRVNASIELQALIRTDRLPRAKKYLWLVPGKVYRWYYSWILQDGSTVTKVETKPIKGIQDDRPLDESHPNMYRAYLGATASAGIVGGFISGAISHR